MPVATSRRNMGSRNTSRTTARVLFGRAAGSSFGPSSASRRSASSSDNPEDVEFMHPSVMRERGTVPAFPHFLEKSDAAPGEAHTKPECKGDQCCQLAPDRAQPDGFGAGDLAMNGVVEDDRKEQGHDLELKWNVEVELRRLGGEEHSPCEKD